MKLRNKKTGEIVEVESLDVDTPTEGIVGIPSFDRKGSYSSLAELNSEWEDYEETDKYWFINSVGGVIRPSDTTDWEQQDANHHKEIGNYFETKEKAELAIRKLKARKRLKDKGIKIIDYECCGGTNKKGEFLGEVKVTIDVPQDVDKYLFETLFGGEE